MYRAVPACVWTSGETSMPYAHAVACASIVRPVALQREARGVGEAERDELVAAADRLLERRADRLRVVGVGAHGRIAGTPRPATDARTRRPARRAAIASTIGIPKPSKRDG